MFARLPCGPPAPAKNPRRPPTAGGARELVPRSWFAPFRRSEALSPPSKPPDKTEPEPHKFPKKVATTKVPMSQKFEEFEVHTC